MEDRYAPTGVTPSTGRAGAAWVVVGLLVLAVAHVVMPLAGTGGVMIRLALHGDTLGAVLLLGLLLYLLPPALVGFAGALDSAGCRAAFAVLGGLGSIGGLVVLLATSSSPPSGLVCADLVVLLLFVGYGMLSGLACRVVSGLLLALATLVSTVTAIHLAGLGTVGAQYGLGAVGFGLCAVGAFTGPGHPRPRPRATTRRHWIDTDLGPGRPSAGRDDAEPHRPQRPAE